MNIWIVKTKTPELAVVLEENNVIPGWFVVDGITPTVPE
jgi:hypothetical protein